MAEYKTVLVFCIIFYGILFLIKWFGNAVEEVRQQKLDEINPRRRKKKEGKK